MPNRSAEPMPVGDENCGLLRRRLIFADPERSVVRISPDGTRVAFRAVDRYGVTRGNEQYLGWAQLPAASDTMDKQAATQFLKSLLGVQIDYSTPAVTIAEICKRARIEYHPDQVADENAKLHRHEIFVRIGQAEKVLTGVER